MHMRKTRIKSDRFKEYKKSMEAYEMPMINAIPVDLYGKRVGGSMEEQGQEIKDFYDLDEQG